MFKQRLPVIPEYAEMRQDMIAPFDDYVAYVPI